jgi:23S rRNA (cytidine2498-2'-O)-methyltransferase
LLTGVAAHCRAGFEPEAARDLAAIGEKARVALDTHVVGNAGFVTGVIDPGLPARRWQEALDAAAPAFVRSAFFGSGPHIIADPSARGRPDRVTPLVAAVGTLRAEAPFGALWIEHPDTNEGKALSSLARSLHARLAAALTQAQLLDPAQPRRPRLHVLLADGATAWVGMSDAARGSPWPMGIPRLRMPGAAPSRSTQKLAEAFVTFLGARESDLVRAGMRAVDLGAAPGGWTWQLARRGLRVTAVDNGALKGEVASDPLVTHVREDGLRYRPRRPVDWVVCDIVESPSRIATLMARWMAEGLARHAMFNLKLPMKKRYDELLRCRDIIGGEARRAGTRWPLAVRQLYHDREEVTAWLSRG